MAVGFWRMILSQWAILELESNLLVTRHVHGIIWSQAQISTTPLGWVVEMMCSVSLLSVVAICELLYHCDRKDVTTCYMLHDYKVIWLDQGWGKPSHAGAVWGAGLWNYLPISQYQSCLELWEECSIIADRKVFPKTCTHTPALPWLGLPHRWIRRVYHHTYCTTAMQRLRQSARVRKSPSAKTSGVQGSGFLHAILQKYTPS